MADGDCLCGFLIEKWVIRGDTKEFPKLKSAFIHPLFLFNPAVSSKTHLFNVKDDGLGTFVVQHRRP